MQTYINDYINDDINGDIYDDIYDVSIPFFSSIRHLKYGFSMTLWELIRRI